MTIDFNSRTHVECDGMRKVERSAKNHFNSRTHVECDPFPIRRSLSLRISTHALTWSATFRIQFQMFSDWISTHALTWSATCRLYRQRKIKKFQLTHSRGVRRELNGCFELYLDFNSRTHVECDSLVPSNVPDTRDFNSRTHVECDSKYCIKKRFATQYMGSHCFLSSIILIFFIYSKK